MTELPQSDTMPSKLESTTRFGLHQLRQPISKTTLIFVHGILSNSEAAWGNPSWPDLVAEEEEFSSAGIYVFTYRTGLTSRTYSVSDATDALREYFSEFDIWNQEKIVFVCHSMGGIVVRRFIVSNQVRLIKNNMTLGLFMVASPSLGSRDANLLSMLSFAFQHTQAAILRFSQSNTTLDDLNRDFRTLLSSKTIRIVGRELIEDQPIKVKRWLGLWRQVVEPFAAAAYFHGEGYEPLRIPGSDHLSIVKPLSREALQHQALVRFLRQLSTIDAGELGNRPAVLALEAEKVPLTPQTLVNEAIQTCQGASNEEIFQASLSRALTSQMTFPLDSQNIDLTAKVILDLRAGRMIERMFASAVVRKHANPTALFLAAAELASSQHHFEFTAPWLRWLPNSFIIDKATEIFEERFKPSWVDGIRMRARFLGWSGKTVYPVIDWEEGYQKEKFSHTYAMAYAHAAWRDQSEATLHTIVDQLIEMNKNHAEYYRRDISFFDWLSAMKGIPPSNARILLREMLSKQAPTDIVRALLARMQMEPAKEAVPHIVALIRGDDQNLRLQATKALAFIPAPGRTIRDLKQESFEKGSIGDVISAGIDFRFDAVDDLGALLTARGEGELAYYTAWSLGQLASRSSEARRYLGQGARDHSDAVVRAICVVGLAACGAAEAPELVEAELTDSRDIQKLCLLIARTYTEDVTPLFRFLAETPEDRVYVPFLLVCFQRMFRDALRHAAQHAPMLDELLSLCDDI